VHLACSRVLHFLSSDELAIQIRRSVCQTARHVILCEGLQSPGRLTTVGGRDQKLSRQSIIPNPSDFQGCGLPVGPPGIPGKGPPCKAPRMSSMDGRSAFNLTHCSWVS
jgi:hypothetical protein